MGKCVLIDSIAIEYAFELQGGEKFEYLLELDPKSLGLIGKGDQPPKWAALDVGQCSCCPLVSKSSPNCPIAVNLATLLDYFKDVKSFVETDIVVRTKERTYVKKTSLQKGLFSIFGVIMATSGCPSMDFLKPMARFHLPFATKEETIVRSVSIYLLRQYFVHMQGNTPDLALNDLDERYKKIHLLNKGFVQRIEQIKKNGDVDRNSIVILDCFSQTLSMSISENLTDIAYLFQNGE